ncbi:hypothetical protein K443DRAFT_8516 [Laccaria amethystina LaAM-08-1]|uniref:ER membrane protein complex subunit 1 n=1 Tax=Laccaria amethystina LaAM-08-1 TaxID=1095629 RepID=A0A0C9X2G3_9AGAR|nr:hypothetical protein K443DRAFT_8516 [Laccaria amethystina LaAM-08-1]
MGNWWQQGKLVASREDGTSRFLKLHEDPLSLTSIWQFENSVALDALHTPSGVVVARLLATTAIKLWRQCELKWMREESLATTTSAEFVELPDRVASELNLHVGCEGFASRVIRQISDAQLYVTRTVSDGGDPEVVLVTQRRANNTLVDTVLFHVDAVNGEDVRQASKKSDVFEGLDIIKGPLVEGFLLQTKPKAVVLLDEFLQVYLYHNNADTQAAFAKVSSALSFPLRTNVEGRQCIQGHQILLNSELIDKPVAYTTWSLNLPPSEGVQHLLPAGSRGPDNALQVTQPSLVHCAHYFSNDEYMWAMEAIISWLVYRYFEGDVADGSVGGAKGYRMVTVELYEGEVVDGKRLGAVKDLYTCIPFASVFLQAITALAPTSTKFGISSKDLIAATKNHRIQSYQRAVLKPRRPKRKVTAKEAEEFLIEYNPVLPDDPHRVLSHNYEVSS